VCSLILQGEDAPTIHAVLAQRGELDQKVQTVEEARAEPL
jgi:hypothetical protein